MDFTELSTQQFLVLQPSETEASTVEPDQCWTVFAPRALIDTNNEFGAVSCGNFVIYFFDGLGSFFFALLLSLTSLHRGAFYARLGCRWLRLVFGLGLRF